jgi:tRNA threonylcarbamoyladenosine biosynthesis protein TsaE|tara:strand:- start:110210 stop:110653 length:444 start_codon:yes stop_codon:yes gene_type:complete
LKFESEAEQERFGRKLGALLRPGDVVTLSGPLGAGKTVLARGMLRGAGHEGEVPSPTFTLVQPYEDAALLLPIWHADLYRLDDPGEVPALALDEVLEDGALIVEWPERAGSLLPGPALALTLTGTGAEPRRLTADVPPDWERRWATI